jgi:hypothetical protein
MQFSNVPAALMCVGHFVARESTAPPRLLDPRAVAVRIGYRPDDDMSWRRLVRVLEQIGVKHIFGLIGDSLTPLANAVRRSRIEWIGVRHEEGAATHVRPSECSGLVGCHLFVACIPPVDD